MEKPQTQEETHPLTKKVWICCPIYRTPLIILEDEKLLVKCKSCRGERHSYRLDQLKQAFDDLKAAPQSSLLRRKATLE